MKLQPQIYTLPDGRRLTLREVRSADNAAFGRHLKRVGAETNYLSFGPGDLTPDELDPKTAIQTALQAPEQLWLVADDGEAIVAGLRFRGETRPRRRHRGEFGLTVVQSHWRMGIGRRMVEVLVGWARAQGHIRKIDLHVRTDNRTAIRLYRSLGFRIERCIRRDFLIAGRFYDSYRMGLMLAPANDGSPATDRSPAK